MMRARAKITKPRPFRDSLTTVDALFLVDVLPRSRARKECVKVEIDCNGAVFVDESDLDVMIEMLENARRNLAARRTR